MFPSPYVSVRLRLCQSASMSACTPACLHPQHCSAPSLISPIFIHLSGSVCSSRLSCSFLFSLILSYHSSFSLFLFFSDIFPSYSLDPSCSYRDTLFSVKNPVSRAYSAKLRRTPCPDTPFSAENLVSRTDFRTLGGFSFRDTPFSVKKTVSRAYSAKLRRTPCRDTPF